MTSPPLALATYAGVVGAVLSARRRELGLPQATVADAVGLNVSTWSRIENGESALTIEQLALATERLGLRPGMLLQIADNKITELQKRGVSTSAERWGAAEIASIGAIPVVGASLLGLLGPVGALGAGAIAGFKLYNRLRSERE